MGRVREIPRKRARPCHGTNPHTTGRKRGTNGEFEDDVDILNYARTLEFVEAEFYRRGLDDLGCSRTSASPSARAAPSIRNAKLIPPALSLHSAEARHASFLPVLGCDIGFPASFDEALTREEVLERASPFTVE